jgi:hypothetical protein
MAGIAAAQVNAHAVAGPAGVTNTTVPAAVKNVPFSADMITLYDRTLENGNHIHRETHGKVFRDSQGRVRTDGETPQPGSEKLEYATINDPVQKVIINLNPRLKTAMVFHFAKGVGPSVTAMGNVGNAPASAAPKQAAAKSAEAKPAPGVGTTARMSATLTTSPVQTRTDALGNKYIEGVNAAGTRTTRIIDAGSQGNDKPIVAVTETWFSPELNMIVLSESDDGKSGHSTMKLINITRTEPMAQLFQVPSDYTVKDNAPATASVKH